MNSKHKLPLHTWEAHPLANKAEASKTFIIAIVAVIAVVVLAALMFFSKQFVGQAYFNEQSLNSIGIVDFGGMDAGKNLSLIIRANTEFQMNSISFKLSYSAKLNCLNVNSLLGWDDGERSPTGIINTAYCDSSNHKIIFDYDTLDPEGYKSSTFDVAEINFSEVVNSGLYDFNFSEVEIFDTEGNEVYITPEDLTLEIGGGCLPSCDHKQCGDDGCGGSCGECSDTQDCIEGVCTGGPAPTCTGSPILNTEVCSGDNDGLTEDTSMTLVDECTNDIKCEYVCKNNYINQNGACVPTGEQTSTSTPIIFADANLAAAVRGAAGLGSNDLIYPENVSKIIHLVNQSNNIASLSGIEYLTNLTILDLGNNLISDISYLSGLTDLNSLFLGKNTISDISYLSSLTNLINLDLSNNKISDINSLSGLTNLTYLILSNNDVSDINNACCVIKQINKSGQLNVLEGLDCSGGNACVNTCTPNCVNRQCGDDGCGGSCGICINSQTCNTANQCVDVSVSTCGNGICEEREGPLGSAVGASFGCLEDCKCSDTDGGIILGVRGNVSGYLLYDQSLIENSFDNCTVSGLVHEYECSLNGYLKDNYYSCTTGTTCQGGACVPNPLQIAFSYIDSNRPLTSIKGLQKANVRVTITADQNLPKDHLIIVTTSYGGIDKTKFTSFGDALSSGASEGVSFQETIPANNDKNLTISAMVWNNYLTAGSDWVSYYQNEKSYGID